MSIDGECLHIIARMAHGGELRFITPLGYRPEYTLTGPPPNADTRIKLEAIKRLRNLGLIRRGANHGEVELTWPKPPSAEEETEEPQTSTEAVA